MIKRRLFAVVCVALTLLLTGVGVFALQPSQINPVADTYGFWQNQKQDGAEQYAFFEYSCSCGSTLYGLDLDHTIYMGDIVNIASTAGTGQLTYADCGVVAYFTPSDPHETTAHRLGEFYLDDCDTQIIYTAMAKPTTSASLVILVESTGAETLISDRAFYASNIVGGATNTVRTYALINALSSIYDANIYNKGLSDGYGVARDEFYNEGYQHGYADGQINASENADAFELFDNLFEGVTDGLIPILSFEVFGFSIMGLLSLLVTGFVIMLIVKIIRG